MVGEFRLDSGDENDDLAVPTWKLATQLVARAATRKKRVNDIREDFIMMDSANKQCFERPYSNRTKGVLFVMRCVSSNAFGSPNRGVNVTSETQ